MHAERIRSVSGASIRVSAPEPWPRSPGSAYPISPGSREADITATSTCSGSPARSEPARGSSDFRKYARRADCASERLGPKSAKDQETTAGNLQSMTGRPQALCAATNTIGIVITPLATGLLQIGRALYRERVWLAV